MKIINAICLRLVFIYLFFPIQTIVAQSDFDKTLEIDRTDQGGHN